MNSGPLFLTRCTGGDCPRKNDCYRFRMVKLLIGSPRTYPTPPFQPDGQCVGFLIIVPTDKLDPAQENT